jgi:DHA2 family multidrug resistance protein
MQQTLGATLFQNHGSDAVTAYQQAIVSLARTVNTQVAVLAYADIFRFVGVVFILSLPLLLFLEKGRAGAKVAAH